MKKSLLLRSCAFLAVPMAANTILTTAAEAQQITTEIQGQVNNDAGQPLAGATVTVTDTRTGASQSYMTNAQGLFSAQNLTTGGPYTITAEASEHQGQTVEQIMTSLQGATQLTFDLAPITAEVASDTIVVTATRVRATRLEVGPGTAFSTEVIENTPSFNRDVRDIIRQDPRVSLDREDVSSGGSGADRISCLGGNDRGNTFTVDGLAQSDLYGLNDTGFSSRSSTPVPYDAVRETQVQFAPMDVEYGNFSGCAINVVTKSGTNRFHGGAFYEYSNNDLRGEKVDGAPVGAIQPDKRWGVSFGGPIFKDRLFVFAAYEEQKAGQSQDLGPAGAGFSTEIPAITVAQFDAISSVLSSVYGVETGPLVHSRPFTNKRFFGRADWQITDDHRLEATYQRLKESTMSADDFFGGSSPQVAGLNTFFLSGTNSKYYSGRLYSTWSDRLSTELRYSRAEIVDIQDPVGGGEAQSDNPIPRIIVGIDNPTGIDGTVLAGPGSNRSANDLQTKVNMWKGVVNLENGNHKLKLGMEVNKADIFNLFVSNATSTLVFRNLADLQAGLLSPGVTVPNVPPPGNLCSAGNSTFPTNVVNGCSFGAFGNFSRTGDITDAAAEFSRTIYSVYAQDDWRVNDQLNAVMGVRIDMFRGGSPDLNQNFVNRYGFENTTGFSDIAPVILPRLGATYDLGDLGVFRRARLTGGIGIFSGGDPLVWFGNAFQNNGFGFAEGNSSAAACGVGQIDVVVNGTFTGVPSCIQQNGINTANNGLGDTQSIDPNVKMPTVWRANFGFQSEINFGSGIWASGWRINADYIYSYYKNPFTIVDLSQTPDIRQALGSPFGPGFTADGRPIYAAIDPTRANCDAVLADINPTPIWTGVTAACFGTSRDDELMLTNAGGYHSHIASAILSKNFDQGILTPGGSSYFTLGYAYTAAQDRRNMLSSTAGSNYDRTAAFDRQNPKASRGFYGSTHNITFSGNFREEFLTDLGTSFGFSFVARSGRPYSLTWGGTGIFNDTASGEDNALVYLPTGPTDPNISPTSSAGAVAALVNFANSTGCAKKYIGRTIKRNTCENDWYYDLDLRFSQDLPGPARLLGSPLGMKDSLTFYAMMDNFFNFLNDSWNVQRRRETYGRQDIAVVSGIDAQGRYIINNADQLTVVGSDGLTGFQRDEFINTSSSLWRVKVGVSYKF